MLKLVFREETSSKILTFDDSQIPKDLTYCCKIYALSANRGGTEFCHCVSGPSENFRHPRFHFGVINGGETWVEGYGTETKTESSSQWK
jgi:hypothetical protein